MSAKKKKTSNNVRLNKTKNYCTIRLDEKGHYWLFPDGSVYSKNILTHDKMRVWSKHFHDLKHLDNLFTKILNKIKELDRDYHKPMRENLIKMGGGSFLNKDRVVEYSVVPYRNGESLSESFMTDTKEIYNPIEAYAFYCCARRADSLCKRLYIVENIYKASLKHYVREEMKKTKVPDKFYFGESNLVRIKVNESFHIFSCPDNDRHYWDLIQFKATLNDLEV